VAEHRLALALHVLVKPNSRSSLGQHHFQRGLAALQRVTAQVVTVQFDQVEGI
jgi:hypothetical protein